MKDEYFRDIDLYCDNSIYDLDRIHPDHIHSNKTHLQKLETQLANNTKYIDQYHWLHPLLNNDTWWGNTATHMDIRVPGPTLQIWTNHYAYMDECKARYPQYNERMCAYEYSMVRPQRMYEIFMYDNNRTEDSYHFNRFEGNKLKNLDPINEHSELRFCKYTLYIGLLLNLLEINIKENILTVFMLVANFVMMSRFLYQPWFRYGVDTTAYIVQAGQFWSGQTNYWHLSSL